MRKLLSYISLLSCLISFGQHIPNGDFENWEVRDHFKSSDWFTPSRNVERTTDTKSGEYAIKLSNTFIEGSNGISSYAFNYRSNNLEKYSGFAFDGDPLSLAFYAKYDIAEGDKARIVVTFRNKGATNGYVDFRFTGNSNDEFEKFTVPITWYGARIPDSVWINVFSYEDGKVDGDGYVIFDDIHFDKIGQRMDIEGDAGFENWTNIGVDYTPGWRSIDLRQYELHTGFLPERSSYKISGDEAFKGDYSFLLKNWNGWGIPRAGFCHIGSEDRHLYSRAFAVNDSFHYLQGYYKYLPEDKDTALIMYRTWEEDRSRSYDVIQLTEATEWTFFSMPINYYVEDALPDSAALVLYSASGNSIRGFNSALYLDNLDLVMEPTPISLGISELSPVARVFPNPTTGILHLNSQYPIQMCTVRDLLGHEQVLKVVNNSIDLSPMANGLYFLSMYNDNKTVETLKIIKH